jgi:hypothetical protein
MRPDLYTEEAIGDRIWRFTWRKPDGTVAHGIRRVLDCFEYRELYKTVRLG